MRFETAPGEQAQVDWVSVAYVSEDGRKRRIWAFVMVLGRDADGPPEWNRRMLDFSLRMGFELRLCRPYQAQIKGKVESGVKYVRGSLWLCIRFTEDADLNRQVLEWCDTVANRRVHGTTHRVPREIQAEELPYLGRLPERSGLAPYLMEDLRRARAEHNLDRRMRVYRSPKLFVVDEFGIWPYDWGKPPPSLPSSQPATNVAASFSLPTRDSGSGESCWTTPSSPRRSWTGCYTTAMCSTSGARATGSRTSGKPGCSLPINC